MKYSICIFLHIRGIAWTKTICFHSSEPVTLAMTSNKYDVIKD